MRTLRRPEPGKPAAALAIIATIFATALIIKLLPPSTRHALVITAPDLPSRALVIWSAETAPVSARSLTADSHETVPGQVLHASPQPLMEILPRTVAQSLPSRLVGRSAEREGGSPEREGETSNSSESSLLPAANFTVVALPIEVAAEPAGSEMGNSGSPLVMPLAKTGSALRFAFAKTGSAIKAAASGTAGVFVPHP